MLNGLAVPCHCLLLTHRRESAFLAARGHRPLAPARAVAPARHLWELLDSQPWHSNGSSLQQGLAKGALQRTWRRGSMKEQVLPPFHLCVSGFLHNICSKRAESSVLRTPRMTRCCLMACAPSAVTGSQTISESGQNHKMI